MKTLTPNQALVRARRAIDARNSEFQTLHESGKNIKIFENSDRDEMNITLCTADSNKIDFELLTRNIFRKI